jgi:hypothetical protein
VIPHIDSPGKIRTLVVSMVDKREWEAGPGRSVREDLQLLALGAADDRQWLRAMRKTLTSDIQTEVSRACGQAMTPDTYGYRYPAPRLARA